MAATSSRQLHPSTKSTHTISSTTLNHNYHNLPSSVSSFFHPTHQHNRHETTYVSNSTNLIINSGAKIQAYLSVLEDAVDQLGVLNDIAPFAGKDAAGSRAVGWFIIIFHLIINAVYLCLLY